MNSNVGYSAINLRRRSAIESLAFEQNRAVRES
jgi:hypothetical protein